MSRLSPLQRAYVKNAHCRYNVKTGATGSGKTHLDLINTIPRRIRQRAGQEGVVVLLGNTRGTLQRNILAPMRRLWGEKLVSEIRPDGTATLFGEKCYCLGAFAEAQVARLQGTSVKYAYCDEVTTWHPEVFTMLKSRLRLPCSCMDGTCNPADPDHWFKTFLDGPSDIFQQNYTLDDNPFLDKAVVAQLKRDYAGTVYYDRYILGRWARAEGMIFHGPAAAALAPWPGPVPGDFSKITIGVDFGGQGSATRFCCLGFEGYDRLWALMEDGLPPGPGIDAQAICEGYVAFARRVLARFARLDWTLCDSASPTLIHSLRSAARQAGLPYAVQRGIMPCRKNAVSQRPITIDRLLTSGRLRFLGECPGTLQALAGLRWDSRKRDRPEDKNIGQQNDLYDAFCYGWLDFVEYIDGR